MPSSPEGDFMKDEMMICPKRNDCNLHCRRCASPIRGPDHSMPHKFFDGSCNHVSVTDHCPECVPSKYERYQKLRKVYGQ